MCCLKKELEYNKKVGIIGLIDAFDNGCSNKNEIAEYLNITVDYLNEVINYYHSKYGSMYRIDNYLIYFYPKLYIGVVFN